MLVKENHDLFKQNNESNTRSSITLTLVGKGKVISYEDILEVQRKGNEKEAAGVGRPGGGGSVRTRCLHLHNGLAKNHVQSKLKRHVVRFKHWDWEAFVLSFDSQQLWESFLDILRRWTR